eukprot:EG_transcript_24788
MAGGDRMPRLVALDIDYTLWPFWVDTHRHPPFRQTARGVVDGSGEAVELFPDVPSILLELHANPEVQLAYVSRTGEPAWAEEAARLVRLADSQHTMWSVADHREVYPGSKLTHFQRLHQRTGIPYSEMLFFDDESQNREVAQLGVTFVLLGHDGLTRRALAEGLALFRANQGGRGR